MINVRVDEVVGGKSLSGLFCSLNDAGEPDVFFCRYRRNGGEWSLSRTSRTQQYDVVMKFNW